MFTHNIIPRSLLTAFVLSMTTVASAHVFPRPQTKAQVAAEHAKACRTAVTTGASAKRALARFGPATTVTTGTAYRVAGPSRFGGTARVAVASCTRPVRGHVACL